MFEIRQNIFFGFRPNIYVFILKKRQFWNFMLIKVSWLIFLFGKMYINFLFENLLIFKNEFLSSVTISIKIKIMKIWANHFDFISPKVKIFEPDFSSKVSKTERYYFLHTVSLPSIFNWRIRPGGKIFTIKLKPNLPYFD